jgi:elongation factor Ts
MLEHIKELRETTFLSMADCKAAVEATINAETKAYDKDKAIEWLKQKGMLKAAKLETRDRNAGIVHSYIHHDRSIGVLLTLTCETDFVAKNEAFIKLANNLCLHIVGANPTYISVESVEENVLAEWKKAAEATISSKVPAAKKEAVLSGMLDKTYYQQFVLLEQPYILDPKTKIKDLIKQTSAAFGENIAVDFFVKKTVGRT